MATKSKKWRNNFWKGLAVVLIAAFAAGGLWLLASRYELQSRVLTESDEYLDLIGATVQKATVALKQKTSERELNAQVYYCVTDLDGNSYTNGGKDLPKIGVYELENALCNLPDKYYLWEDGVWTISGVYREEYLDAMKERVADVLMEQTEGNVSTLLLYIPASAYTQLSDQFYRRLNDEFMQVVLYPCLLLVAAILVLTCYLAAVAGRHPRDEELHLCFCDRWPAEVIVALGAADCWLMYSFLSLLASSLYYNNGLLLGGAFLILFLVALGMLGLALLLCLVRKAKAHLLWNGSLCQVCLKFSAGLFYLPQLPTARRGAVRILWVGGAAIAATLGFGTLFCSLAGFVYSSDRFGVLVFFGFVFTVVGAVYLYNEQRRDGKELDALLEQLAHTAKSEAAPVTVPQQSGLYPYAKDLAQLNERMTENLDARLKSERMKIDLITNVSHDLKTPLTSIIGYVDLLAKQEDLPAEARDYVLILQQKSEGLKELVSDLFTLAKSTSGSEPVDVETLDLSMAVRQTLADMADTFEKGGIPVRETLPETAPVLAESVKLNRVLQNLLDNAERYSLPGTRIYVRLAPGREQTTLSVQNTANYEMTFTEEEILQRFARGDAARTTDGSGLGLSIAESFMQNFGGKLNIHVEGDTFLVTLTFLTGEPDAPFCMEEEAAKS